MPLNMYVPVLHVMQSFDVPPVQLWHAGEQDSHVPLIVLYVKVGHVLSVMHMDVKLGLRS